MTSIELEFIKWGNGWWRSPFLDQMLPWLTYLGSLLAVILFILISWILIRKKEIPGRLAVYFGSEAGILYGLKYLIRRPRPLSFIEMASALPASKGEILDPSFPSGHAVFAFMMATLLSDRFPRYRVLFYIIAAFIGWTRVYFGLHYPTDVISGALIGYGVTKWLLCRISGLKTETH